MGCKRLRLRLAISGIAFAASLYTYPSHLCTTTHVFAAYVHHYCIPHALCSSMAHAQPLQITIGCIIIVARCMQARPVRFHSQAQGYMFHDAGTNVK